MSAWREAKPTMHLRFVTYKMWVGPNPFDFRSEKKLQQLWQITKGGEGDGVHYEDEWRDVPLYSEEMVR